MERLPERRKLLFVFNDDCKNKNFNRTIGGVILFCKGTTFFYLTKEIG